MKKLGLIGGVGPESTIPYYKGIVFGVQKKVGKPYFPPLTIESLSTFEVIRMGNNGDKEGLLQYMLKGFQNLAAAGAQIGAMACNTGHMVFDELQKQSPIPLVSIVEVTCNEAKRRNYHKIALLGTRATMEEDFFKKPFREAGIEVLVPEADERKYIFEHIAKELEFGIVKEETAKNFLQITKELADKGAEAVILGCTELPLIFDKYQAPIPVLDTMRLHIDALVDAIVEE